MKCRFALTTVLEFSRPVTGHVFRIRPLPGCFAGQTLLESNMRTSSPQPIACVTEPVYGNRTWTGRFDAEHTRLEIESSGIVDRNEEAPAMPAPLPYFSYSTRLTRPGMKIRALWDSLKGELQPTKHAVALSLMHAVHNAMVYRPGATTTQTTAEEALGKGEGVCQDYSHVLLALLRLAGLPALYVAGLVQGTGATHAWVQTWIENRWVALDPTHDREAQGTYVALALGCDFEEAALERGIFLGSAEQTIRTTAVVETI